MTRFNVNLATRPFRNNLVYWIAFGGCFALLTGFSWYNVHQYKAAGGEIKRWDENLRGRQDEFARLSSEVVSMTQTAGKLDLKALNERSAFANGIILSRLFSWSDLFSRLEKVQPETVRLRSIRPVITKEGTEVSVDAMTKDYDSLLRFEASLLDSDYFSFVYPLQESTREVQGEIHFNLAFGYVPAGKNGAAKASEASAPDANSPAEAPGAGEPTAAGPNAAGKAAEEGP